MASDYKKIGGAWQGEKGISFKLEGWPGYAYLFPNRNKQPGDKKPDFDICVKGSVMPDVAAQYMSEYDKRQGEQQDNIRKHAEQGAEPHGFPSMPADIDEIPF